MPDTTPADRRTEFTALRKQIGSQDKVARLIDTNQSWVARREQGVHEVQERDLMLLRSLVETKVA